MVCGGAGFIGCHLCTRLVEMGHDVICVDNLLTGSKDNIRHLLGKPNFDFILHDIRQPIYIEVDEIYNLACPAAPIHYQTYPIKTFECSVLGILNLLHLARDTGCRLLHASTSEVYGDPTVHPQKEEYHGNVNPIGPRSCYDEGKRAAESIMFDYYRTYNLDIRVVRIFNTYGPFMHPYDGRVVTNFIRQALRGEDITIYGNGSQTRSFQYVDDLIEGLIRMMAKDGVTGPFNLGNPVEFTVKELAEKVIKLTGSKSKIVYMDLPVDDPCKRKPDITRAKEALNWEPKVQLDEGLVKVIEYMKEIDWNCVRMPNLVNNMDTIMNPKM